MGPRSEERVDAARTRPVVGVNLVSFFWPSQKKWRLSCWNIQYETENPAGALDENRRRTILRILRLAKDIQQQREQRLQDVHPETRDLHAPIHATLFRFLLAEAAGNEVDFEVFTRDLRQDFPLVGDLPPCEGAAAGGTRGRHQKTDIARSM